MIECVVDQFPGIKLVGRRCGRCTRPTVMTGHRLDMSRLPFSGCPEFWRSRSGQSHQELTGYCTCTLVYRQGPPNNSLRRRITTDSLEENLCCPCQTTFLWPVWKR